jgi:hypothetical protein
LTATPRANLVSNIGFSTDATHTTDPNSPLANMAAAEMEFPLTHPPCVTMNHQADAFVQRTIFGSSPPPAPTPAPTTPPPPPPEKKHWSLFRRRR